MRAAIQTSRFRLGRTVRDDPYAGLGAREGSARGSGNVEGRLRCLHDIGPVQGDRLLDIGCGNGAYTLRLAEGFRSTVGIDVEPDRIGDFRTVVGDRPIEVRLGSAADLPYPDGFFDTATAVETMEHLDHALIPVLAELARVTAPGGSLYLTTPNRLWPLEQHGFLCLGRRYPGICFPFLTWVVPLHRRMSDADAFTPARLDRLIEPHGFRRTSLTHMWPPLDSRPALARRAAVAWRALDRVGLSVLAQTLVMRYDRTASPRDSS